MLYKCFVFAGMYVTTLRIYNLVIDWESSLPFREGYNKVSAIQGLVNAPRTRLFRLMFIDFEPPRSRKSPGFMACPRTLYQASAQNKEPVSPYFDGIITFSIGLPLFEYMPQDA